MEPERSCDQALDGRNRSLLLERTILTVRRLWFDAREVPLGGASAVIEPGGELLMLVDGDAARAEELAGVAAARNACVVVTSYTRPENLASRLRDQGFRCLLRHGVYVFEPRAPRRIGAAERPSGLFGLIRRLRSQPPLTVQRVVHPEQLCDWNEVCWRAFGSRGTVEDSHAEKRRAFERMGARASWYLASCGGRPAGTAILFENEGVGQILAVGTLPGLRGRGIATALLTRILSDWDERRGGLLFLDTRQGSNAERLYLRFGFRFAYLRELFGPPTFA